MLWLLTFFVAFFYLSNYHFKNKILIILLACEFIYLFLVSTETRIKVILTFVQIINLIIFIIIFKILFVSKESPTINSPNYNSIKKRRQEIKILKNMYNKRYQKLLKHKLIFEKSTGNEITLSLSFSGKFLRFFVVIIHKILNLEGKVG